MRTKFEQCRVATAKYNGQVACFNGSFTPKTSTGGTSGYKINVNNNGESQKLNTDWDKRPQGVASFALDSKLILGQD